MTDGQKSCCGGKSGCGRKSKKTLNIRVTKDTPMSKTDELEVTEGNAGVDLRSSIDWELVPGETKLITTSYKIIIPEGHVGMICSRSGLAMKNGVFVLNAPGIIDPSYRGNVGVILHNASQRQFTIHKNDRIAQILFMEYETPNFLTDGGEDFDSDSTERGSNGFGSSGVK